jgi:hypothetical protein
MRKIQLKQEEIRAYYDTHKDEFQREERVFPRNRISTQGKQDNPLRLQPPKEGQGPVDRARRGAF